MMKKITFLFSLFLLCSVCFSQTRPTAPFGLNLAGADFGENFPGVYGEDYYYPTEMELDYFAAKGFKLFRLPFKWERIQPVMGGPLDTAELKRIIDFIDHAAQRNLWIIPDMHNYCRRKVGEVYELVGTSKISTNSLVDAWVKIAKALRYKKNIWGYGLMNEPHDMPSTDSWFQIAQQLITAIRIVDSETPIIVGGDAWSSAAKWLQFSTHLKDLQDPANKIIYEAHVYFDKDGSGAYKYSFEEEEATEQIGVNRVKPFIDWLAKHKKRGFVGEYGVPDDDERWLEVLDKVLAYMQQNGVYGTYWAAGPRWGNYKLAVEPINGKDKPQLKILARYLEANERTK
ncbi:MULTISPECIES: glycoside hydrolase family 5 protein [Olivibacter]|uniref:Glycoside hydrolase family 5 protein n=1 Tax=Olivibacter jilunii TaxID=985016 RepID=A0ABW6B0C4_9SPHI|nr:glycoside hydrolase family 5 protein [Olivibacter sp. UJ_SKK_5.1]MDX3916572.1 glycoside hydrolase family 5 protein [Pseudosphingobacterium sp.]